MNMFVLHVQACIGDKLQLRKIVYLLSVLPNAGAAIWQNG